MTRRDDRTPAILHLLIAGWLLCCLSARAAEIPPVPRLDDRVRIAEAWQLAETAGTRVWPELAGVPFVVLLVTEAGEYLFRHPDPPADFVSLGTDPVSGAEIFARPHSSRFPLTILATFPAISGVNTVVMGTPEQTGKTSTQWVLTAIHEHFHQLQYTRPDYYDGVAALDLAGGDESGMWQLDFPFPYDSEPVISGMYAWQSALVRALGKTANDDWLQTKAALRGMLAPADDRYWAFQLWQEGVARYTELAVAQQAAEDYRPRADFQALPDAIGYRQAFEEAQELLKTELVNGCLSRDRRTLVYPLGAAEALLLDALHPAWKDAYFERAFDLGRLHPDS